MLEVKKNILDNCDLIAKRLYKRRSKRATHKLVKEVKKKLLE